MPYCTMRRLTHPMTEEEKFAQIQQSRQLANGDKAGEGSGVEAHPQAEKTAETEPKADGGKPKEEGKVKETPKEPTEAEKQQHAMAQMRSKFKRENDSLRKEVEELKKWKAEAEAKNVKPKTLSDFDGNEEEYGKFLRKQIEDSVYARVSEDFRKSTEADRESTEKAERLRSGLEGLRKGLADEVMTELGDPDSTMSAILNSEKGRTIADAITESEYGAELLALMHGKPEIFKQMLNLPEKRIEYSIYRLEDQIVALKAQAAEKQKAEAEKQEKANSLPNVGAFGLNGNENKGVAGLSAKERVERYKAEMRNL